jgi:predicted dehydrogenase
MTQRTVKVAIIGCGAAAERGHLPAAADIPNCEITLLVDRNLERAKQLAVVHGIPAVSNEYREALQHADAAILALPHHLHASVSCELMKGGIHVLVEKPMAMSSAECQAMLEAAEEAKVILAVGLMRRFLDSARSVYGALKQGLLGRIKSFDVREGNVYNWPVQSDFFFRRKTSGGGVLLDTGAHTLDLVLWWLGEVASLEYYDDSYGGVEADCELYLAMQSGAKGVVELSRTRNLRNTAIITGEHATIEVHLRRNRVAVHHHDNGVGVLDKALASVSNEGIEKSFFDPFRSQLEDWLAAIRGERPVTVPGTEASRSVALIEKCYSTRRQLDLPWITPCQDQAVL